MDYLLQHKLFFHRLNIRIAATRDTNFDAWTGAVLRNNLLYASEQIKTEDNLTLFGQINRLPLSPQHQLYKEMSGGFPRGYTLILQSHDDITNPGCAVKKGEVVSFSLILTGSIAKWYQHFVQAVDIMCQRGLGHPQCPFLLVDVSEVSVSGDINLLAAGTTFINSSLRYPHRFENYVSLEKAATLLIRYVTPVSFTKSGTKHSSAASWQDKCNNFPGFYQFVRSIAFRFVKLSILYCTEECKEYNTKEIEHYLEQAGEASLQDVVLQKITLPGVFQKEKRRRINHSGYIGEQRYSGVNPKYIPLLQFMSGIGVGNEVVYGMGRYEIEI